MIIIQCNVYKLDTRKHQVAIDQLIVCNVCMSVVTLGDGLVILGVHSVQRVQHVQHVPWHDDSGLDILSSGQHNPLIICRVQHGTAAHCTAPPSYHANSSSTSAPRRAYKVGLNCTNLCIFNFLSNKRLSSINVQQILFV